MKTDIHFGTAEDIKSDWRKVLKDEVDPDDELLKETPQDVINLLGFDPLEFEKEKSQGGKR